MQIELDLDQLLRHVLPWKFVVSKGGKKYPTHRPSIGELTAMQSAFEKPTNALEELLNGLFIEKPDFRWELPIVIAFLEGYMEYFMLHSEKKAEGLDPIVTGGRAKAMVEKQWTSHSTPHGSAEN